MYQFIQLKIFMILIYVYMVNNIEIKLYFKIKVIFLVKLKLKKIKKQNNLLILNPQKLLYKIIQVKKLL